MFYSSRATVWTPRNLVYNPITRAFRHFWKDIPNDIYYDLTQDQYMLVCDNGKVMTLPSCFALQQASEVSTENLFLESQVMQTHLLLLVKMNTLT